MRHYLSVFILQVTEEVEVLENFLTVMCASASESFQKCIKYLSVFHVDAD